MDRKLLRTGISFQHRGVSAMEHLSLCQRGLFILAMLIFGSYNTLNLKWEFQTCVPTLPEKGLKGLSVIQGCPEGERMYNKPWMNNWVMFWAEFSIYPLYKFERYRSARKRISIGKQPRPEANVNILLFAVPGFCDVLGSGLSAVGMMFISATVWQMMRGALIVCTSALSVIFLKRRLKLFHYVAIGLTVIGLFLIGFAATVDAHKGIAAPGSSQDTVLIGIGFTLLAQLASSSQCAFEEYLLQGKKVSAKLTVAMEGFWGIIFQGLLLVIFNYVPGSDHGTLESFPDTLQQYFTLPGSATLLWLTATYMASIDLYNVAGLKVTKSISAVTRCLIDSCRILVVWSISLVTYYFIDERYGVPWTDASYVQVIGFIFLVCGTLIYNQVFRIPGLDYEQDDDEGPPAAAWSPTAQPHRGLDDWEFSPPVSPMLSPASPGFGAPQEDGIVNDLIYEPPDVVTL